jgi:hypothetical protein
MKKFTIIALALALAAVFAVTAAANEWNLYGSARMETFYESKDLGDGLNAANEDSEDDLDWTFQNNARVGATVKGDTISARFEYGSRPAVRDSGAITNFANVRRLYGVWKFTENWGLKVGKDYTPITFFLSGQVVDADNGLLQTGNAYGARKGQVAVEGMGFKFAAIEVSLPARKQYLGALEFFDLNALALDPLDVRYERWLPKLEGSYEYKMSDTIKLHGFAGYQTFDVNYDNLAGGTSDFSVDSWVLGLGGEFGFGPFFVKPQVSYYQNGKSAGWLAGPSLATGFENNNSLDVDDLMAMVAIGFKPTESLTLEAGVGYVNSERDANAANVEQEQDFMEYYLQAVVALAKGVYIVPEIGYRDFGDLQVTGQRDRDLGDLFYAGAKWQIDF